ncbi:methyltransferase domain-containing protein [Actinomadura roseirufa]|uniref:methyltransferase domain-containing protein n=1 Tax=Actinomadura roseirufa TaxID=2094049 RepID=UPI0010414084|nr:methyltransferase domain-containing protein [Actinomadura roseirufa]
MVEPEAWGPGGAARLIEDLIRELEAGGLLTAESSRAALRAVPRHLFVPPVALAVPQDGGPGRRIDRSADPAGWWRAAYEDLPIVTQAGDGAAGPAAGPGTASSSLSAPGVAVAFLEMLGVLEHDGVLDIGTGTGWTAALIADRPGVRVTSVEIDPDLSARAAANLRAAGRAAAIELVTGDGAAGVPGRAPFDAVHAACGVAAVPYAWIEQTRPGGTIVLPWMPWYQGGHRARLTVLPDRTAVGTFTGGCGYMRLRSERRDGPPAPAGPLRRTAARVDPRRVFQTSPGADVAVAGALPGLHATHRTMWDGAVIARLWTSDSGAQVTTDPGGSALVQQYGPRDLWDEVLDAFFRWVSWGSPPRGRFGMTVTPDGQRIWCGGPDHMV